MSTIQNFLAQSKAKSRKSAINPGIYVSKVVSTEIDTRYKDNALVITYELETGNKTVNFKEYFILNNRFDRTTEFYKYLNSNGVLDEDDFVGCYEELDLRWDFTYTGKKELTIVKRKFLGFYNSNQGKTKETGGDTNA